MTRLVSAPAVRQRGVILIVLMIVFVLASTSAILVIFDNNILTRQRDSNVMLAMRDAKDALIAYAVLHGDYYSATDGAPGRLICPDTNGDGIEDSPCPGNSLGRLPVSIILPSAAVFSFSNFNSGIDEQFWYTLSDDFKRSPTGILNTTSNGNLSLDGQGGIAAILIAPGGATGVQLRGNNTSANYLEADNVAGPTYVSSDALDPENFNDRVLTITTSEILSPVSARVAEAMKLELNVFHVLNGIYPLDQAEFITAMGAAPAWIGANTWVLNTLYTQVTADSATLAFSNCNIVYTLNVGVPGISKAGVRC
ncbi:MAG: hypothetical protein COA96_05185 [SAR86 cluster bacterium]|uniref:Uncharacterized protein n=1 Tax=SAR86 cluster bacterium TaxID=2030880 RepID=A0A2A5B4A6_9GAMM|nr:MAG: hypothetical protein COA96_05185 [SAR86 cluster bacterium]